jgi:SAM-dependent methyltransferase
MKQHLSKEKGISMRFGGKALEILLEQYTFNSVLDIGSGGEEHADMFAKYGKQVVCVDLPNSAYNTKPRKHRTYLGDFNKIPFQETFDCVWASHVLEHQLNVNMFLKKIVEITKNDGIIAITVPPLKPELVGGHTTLWTPASLLYNLVLANLDCSEAKIFQYGYNISVILRKKIITLPELCSDKGDITKLAAFFPSNVHEGVNGFSIV